MERLVEMMSLLLLMKEIQLTSTLVMLIVFTHSILEMLLVIQMSHLLLLPIKVEQVM